MAQFTAILTGLDPLQFLEVLAAAPRQAREDYFHRHRVRAKPTGGLSRPGQKHAQRAAGLQAALRQQDDEEIAAPIVEAFLLRRRPLLAAALDQLGIEHQDGLTDSDALQEVRQRPAAELQRLQQALLALAPAWEVDLYLRYLGINI